MPQGNDCVPQGSNTHITEPTHKHKLRNLEAAVQIWDKVCQLNQSPEANRKLKMAEKKYQDYCKETGIIEMRAEAEVDLVA